MEKLDSYDRILLETLQSQGRASNVDLSEKTGLSAPQCYRRVRRLETDGVIRGYTARLDPNAVGINVISYVTVTIDRSKSSQSRELEEAFCRFAQVLECYRISGEADYLLKIACPDLKTFSEFLNNDLTGVSGVAGIRSLLCLDMVKSAGMLPINAN